MSEVSKRIAMGVAGAAIAFVVTPVLAQVERPKLPIAVMPPINRVQVAIDLCMTVIDTDELDGARDTLMANGWAVLDDDPFIPAIHIVSATYETTGTFYAEVTTYPTVFLAFCAYEFNADISVPDQAAFEEAVAANGFDGTITTGAVGIIGTWEMQLDGGVALFSAIANGDHFLLQMNWIEQAGEGG